MVSTENIPINLHKTQSSELIFPNRDRSYIKNHSIFAASSQKKEIEKGRKIKTPSYEHNNDRHEKLHKKNYYNKRRGLGEEVTLRLPAAVPLSFRLNRVPDKLTVNFSLVQHV